MKVIVIFVSWLSGFIIPFSLSQVFIRNRILEMKCNNGTPFISCITSFCFFNYILLKILINLNITFDFDISWYNKSCAPFWLTGYILQLNLMGVLTICLPREIIQYLHIQFQEQNGRAGGKGDMGGVIGWFHLKPARYQASALWFIQIFKWGQKKNKDWKYEE